MWWWGTGDTGSKGTREESMPGGMCLEGLGSDRFIARSQRQKTFWMFLEENLNPPDLSGPDSSLEI